MGDIADDVLDGLQCQLCGVCFPEEHGYPVVCAHCWKDLSKEERKIYVKTTTFTTIEETK